MCWRGCKVVSVRGGSVYKPSSGRVCGDSDSVGECRAFVGVTCTYTRYTHSLIGFYTVKLPEDQASRQRWGTNVTKTTIAAVLYIACTM